MSSTVPPQPDDLHVFLESVVDSLTDDPTESLSLLAEASQHLESFAQHEDYGEARTYLEAETNFHLALAEASVSNIPASAEALEKAANGFAALEMEDKANFVAPCKLILWGFRKSRTKT